MTRAWTGELKVRAGFRCTELALVGAIATVIFRIALPSCGDATIVGTGELIGIASDIRTADFVAVITAIVFGIAMKRHRYAAAGFTLEFVCTAGRLCAVLHLVTVIQAIIFSVTHPGFWDTSARSVNNLDV